MTASLVAHVAGFARTLRAQGLHLGLSDEADAVAALTLVDLLDRAEVRLALRSALKVRRNDWPLFDELFDRLWVAGGAAPAESPEPRGRAAPAAPRAGPPPLRVLGSAPAGAAEPVPPGEAAAGAVPGYSAEVLLRKKPFDQCTARDLVEMQRLLARLSLRLASRPSRRLVPTAGRGFVDVRRSFRAAVGTRGELVRLAHRRRALEEPHLVVLCDTSGSMDPHTRFLLTFILSLKRVARRTEVFAFNTSLTRLTPWLVPGKVDATLDRLAAGVPDWSGGTRIGESLAAFVAGYQHRVLDAGAVVVILSDGLDRGSPEVLVAAMQAIRRRARRVLWLNPLLGDPRYQPLARGMHAALPFVDHLAPAHNLESLERLATLVA